MKYKQSPIKKTNHLKNETVLITMSRVFDDKDNLVGLGYSITRQNDKVVPVLASRLIDDGELMPNELEPGEYSVRHTDEEYLGFVSWVIQ